jgi:phage N-6-adenine-methyltransferase
MTEKKTGAGLAKHRSNQNVATPVAFIGAVEERFGELQFDLAADSKNTRVTGAFFGEEQNALLQDWGALAGNLWLNPPFSNIAPWAAKCAERRNDGRWTLFLVPASVGSNWFQEHVAPNAFVLELTDRIRFVGSKDHYPKDMILCCFGFGVVGRAAWHWNKEQKKAYDRKPKIKKIRKTRAAQAVE